MFYETVLITINEKKHPIKVSTFGNGDVPIIICGPGETYGPLLKSTFQNSSLLDKYKFLIPHLYWCQNSPLANLPEETLLPLTLQNLVQHLDEIRCHFVEKKLLTINRIGVYGHSGFSALAFHYAAAFPEHTLFVEAEGPPPFFTQEWVKVKELYFNKVASPERRAALAAENIGPGESAIGESSMQNFLVFAKAYHRMNPLLWYDFKTDHRSKIWGDQQLNMVIFKHYFQTLLSNYDCRTLMNQIHCPVHISLGIFDTVAPPTVWIDPPEAAGIGFFNQKNRRYDVFHKSGHWPATEEPQMYCEKLNKFLDCYVA